MVNLKSKQLNVRLGKAGITSLFAVSVVLSCIAAGTLFALQSFKSASSQSNVLANASSNEPTITSVTALGRLEPEGKITHLSAPAANQRLSELRVKEGEWVKAGQIIAVMDNFATYQALVDNANAKVDVAQARLAQVQAGQEVGDIEAQRKKITEMEAELAGNVKAQRSTIARQEVEVRKAEADYERYRSLSGQGVVSAADTETKRLQAEIERERLREAKGNLSKIISVGEEQIQGARATLSSLMHVQPTDVTVVEAELQEAVSQLRKAQVDLESVQVRSPIAGQILSLNTNVGEVVGSNGIVDIGQTQHMYMIAEVYESDIQHVKVGQSAVMTSDYGGLNRPIRGTVEQIGLLIDKPGIAIDDPAAQADVRVVKIKIRLTPEDSKRVRSLNNLQVRASIQVG
ncbi:HlyD family efflux transporter periplasmic adaptor subunit [Pantanalinema sp. GBBB05]|uniref:HlyD family efflux transporter periplasmic adaptor subunit n=1 Tax=Pantanalinema sp. GBBB05 TaxID=2604139 RepID=UPI001DDC8B3C|nr:HlyD family efflux transporter periplasmic adaptor subunit [Pantanalinema sp. GBBB05]